jgi:hypothetical protein
MNPSMLQVSPRTGALARRAAGGLAAAAVALVAGLAPAQPKPADEAFVLGKALMDQGHVAEACLKFAESLSLERRGGTLLNLASCREKEGRHATALRLFEEARERAVKDGRSDRVDLARREIDRLRPKLSWLTVRLAEGAAAPDLVVQRDGEVLPPDRWGVIEAVDPGPHAVVAVTPGRPRFEATVTVGEAGDAQVVEIPAPPVPAEKPPPPTPPVLAEKPPSPGPPIPVPVPAPAASAPAVPAAQALPPPLPAWVRPAGGVVTGLGVATFVVGLVLGVNAIRDVRESDPLCPRDVCTTMGAFHQAQSAAVEARIADFTIPLGLLAAAGGIYLMIGPRREPSNRPAAVHVSGRFGRGASGLSLEGGW